LFGAYGVCGVVGNFVASRIIDGIGNGRVVGICLALMTAAFMLWPIADGSIGLTIFVVALWGLGGFAIHPAQQTRLVAIEPSLSSTSLALNLSGTYLGQALGGATGGALVASTGTAALPWAGLIALLAACGAAFMASATPEHAARPLRKLW
jgi:predicted MFS family arabinose efflux permease